MLLKLLITCIDNIVEEQKNGLVEQSFPLTIHQTKQTHAQFLDEPLMEKDLVVSQKIYFQI